MARSILSYNKSQRHVNYFGFSFTANITSTANQHIPSCEILLHRLQSLSEVLKHDLGYRLSLTPPSGVKAFNPKHLPTTNYNNQADMSFDLDTTVIDSL